MKILFFASTDDGSGGSGKSLIELVTLLKSNGVSCVVVNPRKNNLNLKLDRLNIENYSVGYRLNICRKDCTGIKLWIKYLIKLALYKICNFIALFKLALNIDFNSIDIIHMNNSVVDAGTYLARKFSIPIVWHIREFGQEDFNFLYFHKNIGKYISSKATKVIAISEAVSKSWENKGVDKKKIVTITHGINPINIAMSNIHPKIKMIFTGKISESKGQLDIVRAISELNEDEKKSVQLDIYGDGDIKYKNKIIEIIKKNKLENVVCLKGYSNDIHSLLEKYNVGIVNSKSEAMGRVTIEYMFAGLCILASNTGANGELLNYGQCGILFDYLNLDDFKCNLRILLYNKNLVQNKRIAARNRALKYYSVKDNVNKFIDLYKEVQGFTQ